MTNAFAAFSPARAKTDLPLPRFVSVKSSEANIRTGPGLRYQIKWVLVRDGLPVEVIAEFENWRKIRDVEGDEGWVHRSMLSNERMVTVVSEKQPLIKDVSDDDFPVAFAEAGANLKLVDCQGEWCKVQGKIAVGWIKRQYLWGVYSSEEDIN